MRRVRGLIAACLFLAGGGVAGGLEWRGMAKDLGRARDLHGGGYVGSAACRGCHDDHLASWHRTFHRAMTAEATPENVLGDFSGATLVSAGVTARMERDARGADALGRGPADAPGRARRAGALLEVMSEDRFPAVRHLACRSLRRLVAPEAPPGRGLGADYDPSADPAARRRVVARLRAALGRRRGRPGRRAGRAPAGRLRPRPGNRGMNARAPTRGDAQLCQSTLPTRVRAPNVLRSPAASRR